MARSIVFGGISGKKPGAYSKISIGGIVPVTPSVGIVGMVGEAEDGVPGEMVTIDDPSIAKNTYGGGPLANALNPIYSPAADVLIPGGPSRVYAIKVNQSTAAALIMNTPSANKVDGKITKDSMIFKTDGDEFSTSDNSDVGSVIEVMLVPDSGGSVTGTENIIGRYEVVATISATEAVLAGLDETSTNLSTGSEITGVEYRRYWPQSVFSAKNYGLGGNSISLDLEAGTVVGSYNMTVAKDDEEEASPDVGGSIIMNAQYTGVPETTIYYADEASAVTDVITTTGALSNFPSHALNHAFVLTSDHATFESGSNFGVHKIKSDTVLTGVRTITAFHSVGTIASIHALDGEILDLTADGLSDTDTVVLPSGWTMDSNVLKNLVIEVDGERRIITANDSNTISVGTAFSATTASKAFKVYYVTDAGVSVYGTEGKATKVMAYATVNGTSQYPVIPVSITEKMTMNQLAAQIRNSGDFTVSILAGTSTTTLASGMDYGPVSNNFGVDIREDGAGLKMDAHALKEWVDNNSALVDMARAIEDASDAYVVSGLEVTDAGGDTVDISAGWIQVGDSVVYHAGTSGYDVSSPISEIYLGTDGAIYNNTSAYPLSVEVVKLADTNGSANVVVNGYLTQFSGLQAPVNAIGGAVPNVVSTPLVLGSQIIHGKIGSVPSLPSADDGSGTTLEDSSANFSDDMEGMTLELDDGTKRRISSVSGTTKLIFKPALADDAEVTSGVGYRITTEGLYGESDNADWQDAAEALLRVRVNHVIPLVSEDLPLVDLDDIHAIFKNHVISAAGAWKNERNVYLSKKGTKDEIIATSQLLNDRNVVLAGVQRPTLLNVDGELEEYPEWGMAVIACGCRAAAEIGLPLTFKFLNIQGLTQDSSWNPDYRTDANVMIDNGVMFAERLVGRGFRFVRDLTTHLKDDNVNFFQDSSNTAVNFITYEIRTGMENAFVGKKAAPGIATAASAASVAAMKAYLDTKIGNYINDVIVAAYNPATTRIKIVGNEAKVVYSVLMINGLDFIKIEEILQLPTS